MNEFNQAKYIQKFQKEKYDRCIFNVPKGQKAVIEEHWKNRGYKSLNAYVNELIKKDMESISDNNNCRENNWLHQKYNSDNNTCRKPDQAGYIYHYLIIIKHLRFTWPIKGSHDTMGLDEMGKERILTWLKTK